MKCNDALFSLHFSLSVTWLYTTSWECLSVFSFKYNLLITHYRWDFSSFIPSSLPVHTCPFPCYCTLSLIEQCPVFILIILFLLHRITFYHYLREMSSVFLLYCVSCFFIFNLPNLSSFWAYYVILGDHSLQ